jgi:ferric iron reductase protein FhuF
MNIMSYVNEIEELQKRFHLRFQKEDIKKSDGVSIQELYDIRKCDEFLDRLSTKLGTTKRSVAASQFAKRYSALFLIPALYSLSVYDRSLDIDADKIWFQEMNDKDNNWSPSVVASESLLIDKLEGSDRSQWYRNQLEQLFRKHLTPLWLSLSKSSGIRESLLWENTAVRIFSLYERKIYGDISKDRESIVRGDFSNLLSLKDDKVFGLEYNPIAECYKQPVLKFNGDKEVRVRKTCCFYYKVTSPAEYCEVCPCVNRR